MIIFTFASFLFTLLLFRIRSNMVWKYNIKVGHFLYPASYFIFICQHVWEVLLGVYHNGCGPSSSPAPRRPEVFPDETRFCSTAVSSGGSPWGALNPPRCSGRAGPQVSGAPRGAAVCPRVQGSGGNGTRPAPHHRCRAGRLQLPPERQRQQPSRQKAQRVKFSSGGPEGGSARA